MLKEFAAKLIAMLSLIGFSFFIVGIVLSGFADFNNAGSIFLIVGIIITILSFYFKKSDEDDKKDFSDE